MNKTNVQYYGAGFDANGRRIVSKICEFDPEKERNSDKVSALINELRLCLKISLLQKSLMQMPMTSI